MLHPSAYIEFQNWQCKLLGQRSWTIELCWYWFRQLLSRSPAVAPVRLQELRYPVFLRPWTSDLYVFEQIFVNREYDTPLDMPASVVDAGANIGLASVYFANRFPDAQIVAVEPEEQNYKMLLINTSRYKNIKCLRAAVWPRAETLSIENPNVKSWAFRVTKHDRNDAADGIPAVSLDALAEQLNGGKPFELIKIDIEGAEKEVFAAGGKWVEMANAIIVECHDRLVDGCERTVMEAVGRHRFLMRRSGEYFVFERQRGMPSE